MAGLAGNYDIINIHERKCFFQYKDSNTLEVLVEIDQLLGDMNKIRVNVLDKQHYNSFFSVIWKLDMIFKIASAIRKMHKAKLLHQDIKFENIFMMNEYTPVIADLGFSML